MALYTSSVPRALESKTKLFGFELADLLLIFLYLSISNLIFGQTALKFLVVWCGTLSIAGVLFFVKRGKPDQFLQHLVEHWFNPSIYVAAMPDIVFEPLEILRPKSTPKEDDIWF